MSYLAYFWTTSGALLLVEAEYLHVWQSSRINLYFHTLADRSSESMADIVDVSATLVQSIGLPALKQGHLKHFELMRSMWWKCCPRTGLENPVVHTNMGFLIFCQMEGFSENNVNCSYLRQTQFKTDIKLIYLNRQKYMYLNASSYNNWIVVHKIIDTFP